MADAGMKRELEHEAADQETVDTSKKARAAPSEAPSALGEIAPCDHAPESTFKDSAALKDSAPTIAARGNADETSGGDAENAAAAASNAAAAASNTASAASSADPSAASVKTTPPLNAGQDGKFTAPPPSLSMPAPTPTPAGLSDEELVRLLQTRSDAKARRDYTSADSIRMTLEQHGITIVDGRQAGGMGTWTHTASGRRCVSRCLPPYPPRTHPPSPLSRLGSGNTLGPDFFTDPNAVTASKMGTPAGATISNEDLVAQLRARTEAKTRRDFTTADAIRLTLEAHGIRFNDASRSWVAADGRSGNTTGPDFLSNNSMPMPRGGGGYGGGGYGGGGFGGGGFGGGGFGGGSFGGGGFGGGGFGGGGFGGGGFGAPTPGPPAAPGYLSTEMIFSKLGEREAARIAKDYTRSDVMRNELAAGGVYIHDKEKTWEAKDGRSGTITRAELGGGTLNGVGGPGAYGQLSQMGCYNQGQQGQQAQLGGFSGVGGPGAYGQLSQTGCYNQGQQGQ